MRSFDVYFDLHLNKRLSKQSWGWWFATSSRPVWHHSNELLKTITVPHRKVIQGKSNIISSGLCEPYNHSTKSWYPGQAFLWQCNTYFSARRAKYNVIRYTVSLSYHVDDTISIKLSLKLTHYRYFYLYIYIFNDDMGCISCDILIYIVPNTVTWPFTSWFKLINIAEFICEITLYWYCNMCSFNRGGGKMSYIFWFHNDIIKWKHFPHHWPFVRGIHWSPVNSPHNGQWRTVWYFLWSAPEQTVE